MTQKFHRGDRVRIADDLGPSMVHFPSGKEAWVVGSYRDQYDGPDEGECTSYTLMFCDDGNTVSWYYESQLSPCAGESGEEAMRAAKQALREREAQCGNLEWICANWPKLRVGDLPGASAEALMSLVGITSPWGSMGEGIVWIQNAYRAVQLCAPILDYGVTAEELRKRTGHMRGEQ